MPTVQAPKPGPKNSTTGRADLLRLRLLRLGLRGAEAVAPNAADRYAASLFFTPRRGALRKVPSIDGHEGQAFRVASCDAEIAAYAWGTGPVVLLVHGWEGHAAQLLPLAAPLLARGYRVVTFDMPGHGRSTGTRASVLDMARAVRDVARETAPLFRGLADASRIGADLEIHAVVGHSLGGAATACALRDGLSPKKVVLLAPAAEPVTFARRAAKVMELSPARTAGLIAQIESELGGDLDAVDVRCIADELRVDALVFHARDDRDVPFAHGEAIAASWPGAELVPLDGLGHVRLLRDDAVVQRAVAFIDGAEANCH